MNAIFGIFASIIAFVSGLFLSSVPINTQPANLSNQIAKQEIQIASTTVELQNRGYRTDFSYISAPGGYGGVRNNHLLFVSPSGSTTTVPDDIWAKIFPDSLPIRSTSTQKENLSTFTMPANPLNPDEIFLATISPDQKSLKVTLHVYSYNLKTSELKEIYSSIRTDTVEQTYDYGTTTVQKPMSLWPTLAGVYGTQLIFVEVLPDDSPGPCISYWRYWGRNGTFSLDIQHPELGLQKFEVPQTDMDKSEMEAKECAKREFGEDDSRTN